MNKMLCRLQSLSKLMTSRQSFQLTSRRNGLWLDPRGAHLPPWPDPNSVFFFLFSVLSFLLSSFFEKQHGDTLCPREDRKIWVNKQTEGVSYNTEFILITLIPNSSFNRLQSPNWFPQPPNFLKVQSSSSISTPPHLDGQGTGWVVEE